MRVAFRNAVLVALLSALTGTGALAQSADLQAAKEQVDMLEHGEALKLVEKVLADPNAKPEDKAAAHWLAAQCYVAMNKKKDMAAELDKLLALHPLYEPRDDEGPADVVKEYRKKARKFRDDHTVTIGEPTVADNVVTAALEKNEKEAASARVLLRPKGAAAFDTAPLTVEGNKVTGPLGNDEFRKKAAEAGGVEYVVQTLTKGGMPNGQMGSEAAPKLVEMTPPPKEDPKPADKKPAEASPAPVAKSGAGAKALGVGVAMIALGVLTGLPALAFTAAGAIMFLVGVLQVNAASSGAAALPPWFNVFRIATNTLNVLGPAMGIASVVLLVFGVVVAVALR